MQTHPYCASCFFSGFPRACGDGITEGVGASFTAGWEIPGKASLPRNKRRASTVRALPPLFIQPFGSVQPLKQSRESAGVCPSILQISATKSEATRSRIVRQAKLANRRHGLSGQSVIQDCGCHRTPCKGKLLSRGLFLNPRPSARQAFSRRSRTMCSGGCHGTLRRRCNGP